MEVDKHSVKSLKWKKIYDSLKYVMKEERENYNVLQAMVVSKENFDEQKIN